MKNQLTDDWYKSAYTLSMVDEAWTKSTETDVDFICQTLSLTPGQEILDLACGYGRHAIALANRGYNVTAIDISSELIAYAKQQANKENVNVNWICGDIRQIYFDNIFDIALNLYDGGIGYALSDHENEQVFSIIAKSLKCGGKHLMHIPNMNYICRHYPQKRWRITEKHIELLDLEWDNKKRYFFETTYIIPYGQVFTHLSPIIEGKRVYSRAEIDTFWSTRNMEIISTYGNFELRQANDDFDDYWIIISKKNR